MRILITGGFGLIGGRLAVYLSLTGNKVDLEHKRKVSTEEAKTCAVDNGLLFTETSAKTDQNVVALFEVKFLSFCLPSL